MRYTPYYTHNLYRTTQCTHTFAVRATPVVKKGSGTAFAFASFTSNTGSRSKEPRGKALMKIENNIQHLPLDDNERSSGPHPLLNLLALRTFGM